MKNLWMLVVCAIVVSLGGCAGGDYIIPLDIGTETGETARTMTTVTGDASMYKEYVRYHAWEVYYQEMEEAQEDSGIKIGYMEVTLSDGTKTYLPTLTVRQPLVLPPPPEVSEHPVWKTANNLLGTALRWGFGYLAVDTIVGGYTAASDNGGYSNYVSSEGGDIDFVSKRSTVAIGDGNASTTVYDQNADFNATDPIIEEGGVVAPVDCPNAFFEDGTWWTSPGLSCESAGY